MAIEKPISEILLSIEKGEYTLPEFQRGFVWKPDQIKGFIKSLYQDYPSGSFLIWKTEQTPKIRGNIKDTSSVFYNLVLDGQQRLTTIYTIFKGKTPDWYEGVALRTDLYFNLESEDFQYYIPKKMEGKKEWLHVSEFLQKGINKFIEELKSIGETNPDLKLYYLDKLSILNKLDNIKNYGYYIKEVSETELEKIVDIFNLVNSSGTRLTENDLALAVITSYWPEIKNKFRETIELYKKDNFTFDTGFFTRMINIVALNKAKYTDIKNITKSELENAWKQINEAIPFLINFLRANAFIDSSNNLSTPYVLYPVIYYLTKNKNKFSDLQEGNKFIYWIYNAQLWGRYSGSTESVLEKDIATLHDTHSVEQLIKNIQMMRGSNLYLIPEDFDLQGSRSRIYNIFYATIRAQNGRDWTDESIPLYDLNAGKIYKLQKHHIFPKAFLYKNGFNSKNTVDKRLVNEIANMSFITEKSNRKILDNPPEEYLSKIANEELKKQFIPLKSDLWKVENYKSFLNERKRLLCDGINKFLKSYFTSEFEIEVSKDFQQFNIIIENIELSIRKIINETLIDEADENPYIEFIPEHIRAKVKGRVKNWLKNNPGFDADRFNELESNLEFFDLQELYAVITFKSNWEFFDGFFNHKPTLEKHFNQLAELRNCIRHSREASDVVIKEAEASILWFSSILKVY